MCAYNRLMIEPLSMLSLSERDEREYWQQTLHKKLVLHDRDEGTCDFCTSDHIPEYGNIKQRHCIRGSH